VRSDAPGRLLSQLADLLSSAVPHDGTDLVVGARFQPDGVDLHLHRGDGHHPVVDVLCGFDAPADWDAVGVVARGRAHRLDPDGHDPNGHGPGLPRAGRVTGRLQGSDPEPVLVVHLQARSGASRSLVGPPGGPLEAMTGRASGRVADVCRRSLGLPTEPADVPVLRWWAAQWLDALVGEAGLELFRHEPQLVAAFPGGAPFGPSRDLVALEHHGRLLEASCPWPALRQAAAAGAIEVGGIDPAAAAWMDDGMFARWAVAEAPACDASLIELHTRLEPDLARRLDALLHRWRVLDAGRPAAPARWSPAP